MRPQQLRDMLGRVKIFSFQGTTQRNTEDAMTGYITSDNKPVN